ncbi:MAG TPA: ribokinase [Rhodanobacteraceae bacterium]|nr:ribokinase [Rhodanobacteraceae bacterium]
MPSALSPQPSVIIVGSYVQDQAWFVERFPRPGETMRANRYNTGPGGKGFNQAVACARQGVPTAFVGVLGRDTFAEFAKRFAEAEGMPCRWQIRDDQPTSTSSITVNAKAENQIAMIFGANEHLDASFVRAQDDLFAGARTLLIQLENNLDALQAALDIGARHGLTRIMNPAPVAADLSFDMLRSADIVTPNETEFSLLLERFARKEADPATLAERGDADLHALARELGVATVVVTLGSRGCFVSHGADRRGDAAECYRLAPEKVKAIDTTGAGDAFSGALTAGLARFAGKPFRDAAIHANRAAAMSTEIVGTAPAMPTYDAVIKRFGG